MLFKHLRSPNAIVVIIKNLHEKAFKYFSPSTNYVLNTSFFVSMSGWNSAPSMVLIRPYRGQQ